MEKWKQRKQRRKREAAALGLPKDVSDDVFDRRLIEDVLLRWMAQFGLKGKPSWSRIFKKCRRRGLKGKDPKSWEELRRKSPWLDEKTQPPRK